jgi:holo-[acyl-carrier protein] synthase
MRWNHGHQGTRDKSPGSAVARYAARVARTIRSSEPRHGGPRPCQPLNILFTISLPHSERNPPSLAGGMCGDRTEGRAVMIRTDPPLNSINESAPDSSQFTLRVGTAVQIVGSIEASITRHGRRYLDQVFTAQEVATCGGYDAEPNQLAPGLAARFCAKEAALKALRPPNIVPERLDIEVVEMSGGWVSLVLTGAARNLAAEGGLSDLQVSLSHDGIIAVATVIGIGRPPAWPGADRR